jgi:hypothetical protein
MADEAARHHRARQAAERVLLDGLDQTRTNFDLGGDLL